MQTFPLFSVSTRAAAHPELDLAQQCAPVAPQRPANTLAHALDLASSVKNAPSSAAKTLMAGLRAPGSVKYAQAFGAAVALEDAQRIRPAAFAFAALRQLVPGDYRAHAQYALLCEQLADAQDAAGPAGSIGKTFVSQPDEGAVCVVSERLDYLEGMLAGLVAYMTCLSDPQTADDIAARNGAQVVEQGRVDTAKSIVWAATQSGALINAMAGAVCAAATHQGIVEGLQSGQLNAADPVVRAQLDEHFAALQWPHLAALKGDLGVGGSIASTVAAWHAWRVSQSQRVYAKIVSVRPQLTEALPEFAEALAVLDRMGSAG